MLLYNPFVELAAHEQMNDYENYSTIRKIITANSSIPIIS
jgi:hypothetical protein